MMKSVAHTVGVVLAFALLAGLRAQAQDGLDLGLDAAGDSCIAVAADGDSDRFSVYCGAWRGPAGELARDASLVADCAPSDLDAALLTCPGNFSGGAILDAAGSEQGRDGTAHFRGLPAAAPALRRGAAVLAGAAAPTEFSGSVSSELAARGVTALEDLRSLRRLGDSLNIAFAFAEAADAYSLSLTFLDGPFAGRVDQRAEIALELALNLSGEGQFTEAAREFARADQLVSEAGQPALEIKRDNYVAAHLMNQGLFDAALRRLDAAPSAPGARARSGEEVPRVADNEITVEEARAANLRGRASDGVDPLSLGAGEVLSAEERESLLLAHRAYLRGVALDVLGRDGVDEAYSEAAGLLSQAPASSAIWVAALLAEKRALRDIVAGRPGQASTRVRPALEAVRALAPRTSLEARLTATLAEALAAQGEREEALEAFGQAFDIFGSIGATQVGVSVERAAPYLRLLLEALNDAGGTDPALLARYVAAFETIAEPAAAAAMTRSSARASSEGGARVEIRALQDAQNALRQASAALQVGAAGADEAELSRLRGARAEAERAVIAAEQLVRTQAPDYQQLVARQVDVAALTGALQSDEVFLAYAASSQGGFGYAARADGSITPFTSEMTRAQVSAAAADLREALQEAGGMRDVVARGGEIYAATVGAARTALDEAGRGAGISSLAYSVRGAVGSVPPAILAAGVEPNGTPHWLVRDFDSIMSAPSAAAFVAARSGPGRQTPGGVIMFGPPVRPSGEALRSLVDAECADFLEAQVYTQPITAISSAEVAVLGARAEPGSTFTTERLANDENLADYSVLVFSTHGFTGAQRCASEPGLLVSIGTAADETADARAFADPLLTASEVVELQLDADLVVLAACDTANMGRTGGLAAAFGSEHLDGLARAFLYAGARNVLATHWAVDDYATDAFVTRLLAEANTKPLAEALVAAQNYFLDNPEQLTGGGREITPALWGGFVLIGDGARGADTTAAAG